MARKPRIHFPGAFYHVILRGNNKAQIFFSDSDREYFYFLIREGITKYNYRIHGFCLMSNHVHLVIQVDKVPLSKGIQNLSFRYTRYINHLQNKVGHLFQGRFKAILVDADNYLLELIRYVHLNPVRAKMVNQPEAYIWSSHSAYLGIVHIPWLTTDLVLSYFNHRVDTAIYGYAKFILDYSNKLSDHDFVVGNKKNYAILGSEKFYLQLDDQWKDSTDRPCFKDIIEIVCAYYQVNFHELKSLSKSRKNSKIRAVIAWLSREYNACTLSELAEFFNRDATGIIRRVGKLREREELILLNKLVKKSFCQA